MSGLMIMWFVAIGATVGSFLNVVIWRLPLGKSLVSPPSHCPYCENRIRWYDNVPIFGWILLGGKCRDCKAPISFRYPLVETVCAIFAGAVIISLISMSLTLVRPPFENQPDMILPPSLSEVLLRSTWLFLLHSCLFAAGMIELDRNPVPRSIAISLLVVALIGGVFLPQLYPIPWNNAWPWEKFPDVYLLGRPISHFPFMDMTIGGLAGLVINGCTSFCIAVNQRRTWIIYGTLIGLFLGWQVSWMILCATLPVHFACFFVTRRSIPLLCLTVTSFFINILIIQIFSQSFS